MNVNLDSFRALAEGKYNLGSVVVTTNADTHEQQLAKVDNHRHLASRNVKPTPEENVKTRQVLSSLMKAHLQKIAGADLQGNAGLRAELEQLDKILLGKDIRKPLKRSGALAGAFWAFDNLEARLLKTRAVTNRLRAANAARVTVDEVKSQSPSADVKSGEAQSKAEAGTTKTLKYYDGTSPEPVIIIEKASDKSIDEFNALLQASRNREAVTDDLQRRWETHPEDMPRAVRARKSEDTARKLRKEDQKIVDLLTKKLTASELGHELAQNPAVAHAMQKELFGVLKYLAKVQADHVESQASLPEAQRQALPAKTVSVKVYVDNAKISTTTMDLTLKSDGRLELGLRGHRFELAYEAQEFGRIINASSTVKPRSGDYFSKLDGPNPTLRRENGQKYFCVWNGNEKAVAPNDAGMVRMRPMDDSRGAEAKLVEILDKLRELNNREPLRWGGSPHYGNEMPQLEAVKYSRFGKRTWAHIRSYCSKQIEQGGMHAIFGRTLAKIQGVPLEAGQSCGLSETKFEKAALFLNKVRLLALNVNEIMPQFENRDNESDSDAINRVCSTVSEICQLQLHPNEGLTMHTKQNLQEEILTLIRATLNGYSVALQKNILPEYFTALADGVCFQGCVTAVSEFLDRNGSSDLSRPTSVYPADVQESVKRQLEDKISALKSQIVDLDSQILNMEGKALGLTGEAEKTELKQKIDELKERKIDLGKQLEDWKSREIGTGALYIKDGQVVLDRLPKADKAGRPVSKAQENSLEWSSTPPFLDEVLSPLMRDIYHEIKFGSKKDSQIGKPPFYIPKVDQMVDLIVERFAQLAHVAAAKGQTQKKPELEKELDKLKAERKNLEASLQFLPDSNSPAQFIELLKNHYTLVQQYAEKARAYDDSKESHAQTDKINTVASEVKASKEYQDLMSKVEAKTQEVESSEAYVKIKTELDEQISQVKGSKKYSDLVLELKTERDVLAQIEAERNVDFAALQARENELKAEQERIAAWQAEGKKAAGNKDQAKVAELMKRPEAGLFNEWRTGAKANEFKSVQSALAEVRPRLQKIVQLQAQQAELEKPFLDEAATKQNLLKSAALKSLRAQYDKLFDEVTQLKKVQAEKRTQFMAPFEAKLKTVEQSLEGFRKSLPSYDDMSCSSREKKVMKKLKTISVGISDVLKRTGEKANQARKNLSNKDFDPKLVKEELQKRLNTVDEQVKLMEDRIAHVDSLEINLAMVADKDSYGKQNESFIYLSATDLEPENAAKLAAFKLKIRDELVNGQYCYIKSEGGPEVPSFVIGEERLSPSKLNGIRGAGFGNSGWSEMLHGSEFFKGVSENGDDVYRSNEGVEVVSPQVVFDHHRRSCETEDYQYEDGDMKLEFLIEN